MHPDTYTIIHNLTKIAGMIQAISIIMGVSLIFSALFHFKRYGEQRTFMSQNMSLAGPGLKLLAGAIMLMLPAFIDTATMAFWAQSSPLRIGTGGHDWDRYIPVVLMFVRIIGVGAIIRSIIMFSRAGNSQGQPGQMGKACVLFMSGFLLIHIVGTYHLLFQILDAA